MNTPKPDRWQDDIAGIGIACFLLALAILFAVCAVRFGTGAKRDNPPCQLIAIGPTGATEYCGKACLHDLKTYTYLCPEGYRAEVR